MHRFPTHPSALHCDPSVSPILTRVFNRRFSRATGKDPTMKTFNRSRTERTEGKGTIDCRKMGTAFGCFCQPRVLVQPLFPLWSVRNAAGSCPICLSGIKSGIAPSGDGCVRKLGLPAFPSNSRPFAFIRGCSPPSHPCFSFRLGARTSKYAGQHGSVWDAPISSICREKVVRLAGLEPARVTPLPPQSSVSANSTICGPAHIINQHASWCARRFCF